MEKKMKILAIVFLVVAAIGFLDATYLTAQHYSGNIPPCLIAGCEVVLVSPQSVIAGVPLALLGSIYYLALLILSIAYLDSKKKQFIRLAAYLAIAGFAASLYFVYLQLFVIKEICQYCMLSAGTSTTLFILGLFILFKSKETQALNV
ncbi:hypothetical protein A3A09_00930 [Candidatus Nomurabacteria bacterium RIFCSPLOWO2_01_FULL_42_20]|nr:MAG: hypothetical protein A3A09_00930 [Candidatus Nomurabacteria bacterium RIFCSPLOWO2_01_FULL_42_20]